METGTTNQNIENPLFLLPLFGEEIFVVKSDIHLLSSALTVPGSGSELAKTESINSSTKLNESTEQIPAQNQIQPSEQRQVQLSKDTHQPKQKVKLLNVFLDSADGIFSEDSLTAYEKLMTNLKIDGMPLQFEDVSMLNIQNSVKVKSLPRTSGLQISPDLWEEFEADYFVLWSDMQTVNPSIKHYSMSNFNNSKLIFLPGFNSMLSSPELKKNVWIAFKQLLSFV